MITKTSIRFFNNKPVRARWNDDDNSWWYVATDVVDAFINTKNSRRYWNTFKNRHPEVSSLCRQLKITASDGKRYNTDCLNQSGMNTLLFMLPTKEKASFATWISGSNDSIDEQSKNNAYELYENSILDSTEVGTIRGLQQIHAFIFGGLYDFAGQIRSKNISKGGFMFANCQFFDQIFETIDSMPDRTVDEIISKYVEANVAHPFMEGNGRATRIWLDHMLKNRVNKCVDWQRIEKDDYLKAMELSPVDPSMIITLIKNALTDNINDRELFVKGIDYSYYYEAIE